MTSHEAGFDLAGLARDAVPWAEVIVTIAVAVIAWKAWQAANRQAKAAETLIRDERVGRELATLAVLRLEVWGEDATDEVGPHIRIRARLTTDGANPVIAPRLLAYAAKTPSEPEIDMIQGFTLPSILPLGGETVDALDPMRFFTGKLNEEGNPRLDCDYMIFEATFRTPMGTRASQWWSWNCTDPFRRGPDRLIGMQARPSTPGAPPFRVDGLRDDRSEDEASWWLFDLKAYRRGTGLRRPDDLERERPPVTDQ